MESGLSLFKEEQISPHDWNKVNRGTNGRREGQRSRGGKGQIMQGLVDRCKNFDFHSAGKSVHSINSSEDWYVLGKLVFYFGPSFSLEF